MNTSTLTRRAAPGTEGAVLGWIRSLITEIRRDMVRRRTYRSLAALDDRTLRDIGIDRAELWPAVERAIDESEAVPGTGVIRKVNAPADAANEHRHAAAA